MRYLFIISCALLLSSRPQLVIEDGIRFLVYPDGTWVWIDFHLRYNEPKDEYIEIPDADENYRDYE